MGPGIDDAIADLFGIRGLKTSSMRVAFIVAMVVDASNKAAKYTPRRLEPKRASKSARAIREDMGQDAYNERFRAHAREAAADLPLLVRTWANQLVMLYQALFGLPASSVNDAVKRTARAIESMAGILPTKGRRVSAFILLQNACVTLGLAAPSEDTLKKAAQEYRDRKLT